MTIALSREAAASVSLLLATALAGCGGAGGGETTRTQIRAVGSSTVYPFTTAVAEQFAQKNKQFKSPIVESTGTGAGFKLFCAGVGARHPDIEDASRRIKPGELETCRKNGVKDIVEIPIGLDGIAFAEAKGGARLALSSADLYKALAANPFGRPQTAKLWSEVNPKLPPIAIKIYGPPTTSGTRDALEELVMVRGCDTDPAMAALARSNPEAHKKACTTIREDEAYVNAGENDNLIVQKIEADPKAIGIFGYSFLEENRDRLIANSVDGVEPSYQTITSFAYHGARPLFIYVKAAHLKAVPGLREFVAEYASAWNPDGYLDKRGLVVAPAETRTRAAAIATSMTLLDPATVK